MSSYAQFVNRVKPENFAENVIANVHWLLQQEFECVALVAAFESDVWRQQMKDCGSCDIHYTISAKNKLHVHCSSLGVAGVQVSFVFNAANKYQYFSYESLRQRIETVLRDRIRGLMHIYGELLSILSHAQLSPVLLTYLTDTPRHLCRLAQTCTLANYICERDFLWRRMIAHHFSALPRCVPPYKLAYARLYTERANLTRHAAPMRDEVAPFGGRMPNIFPNHPDAPPQFVHPLADDPMNDPLRIGPPRYPRGPRGDPNLGNLFPNPSRGRHNPDDFWDGSGSSGGGMFG